MTLRPAALAFGLLLVAAACTAPAGSGATISPSASVPEVTVTDEPTPSAASTAVASGGSCDPASLYAEVLSWNGGAGHRIATVQLTNIGTTSCTIRSLAKPQLIGGDGTVLIDGTSPTATVVLTLAPNAIVSTMVEDGNYCGATPTAPVTVAFVFPGSAGRIVAGPVTPDDVDGVPPCTGSTAPGDIEMQPWAP
jgi:hypothetical protein